MSPIEKKASLFRFATGALLSASLLVPLRITWAAEIPSPGFEVNAWFLGSYARSAWVPGVFNPSAQAFLPPAVTTTGQWQSQGFWDGVGPLPGSYATADAFFKAYNLNPTFGTRYWSVGGGLNAADPAAPWNSSYTTPLLQQGFAQPAFN